MPIMDNTQDDVNAVNPADCAKPTMWTSGIECETQQKKLMSDSVQKPSSRSTLLHSALADSAWGAAAGRAGAGAAAATGFGVAPYGSKPISCGWLLTKRQLRVRNTTMTILMTIKAVCQSHSKI